MNLFYSVPNGYTKYFRLIYLIVLFLTISKYELSETQVSPYTILITFFFFSFSRNRKRYCVLYQNKPHLLFAIPVENDLLYTQHRLPLTWPWRQEWNSRKSRAPTTDIDMLCTKSAMKNFWDKLQSPAGVSCTASMAHTATNTFIKHVAGG